VVAKLLAVVPTSSPLFGELTDLATSLIGSGHLDPTALPEAGVPDKVLSALPLTRPATAPKVVPDPRIEAKFPVPTDRRQLAERAAASRSAQAGPQSGALRGPARVLALTGANIGTVAALGIVLLLLGAVLVTLRRRRTA
jgi:LPXTG-motif cell wall-anchored protein